ncbi:MAG: UDP-N-acetylglucosamine 2-epimerase (non-hydrolyzing) [Acidobacteria bacterium]|nr:UDP-N-acetylglucosamine 2-epimerase (non-hydrolyzing) [Acidobacteriota bacterium]
MKSLVTVLGARPQFIKAGVVSDALRAGGVLREVLVHTGQHHDANMSDVFFAELGLAKPAHTLGIHGGRHGEMTGRMLEAIERVLLAERPAAVLVYGDTNSTLAGALAAVKLHIPVAHVEAGLRSFNRRMPEEINRVMTDHLSDVLFCPTDTAIANLKNEGITQGVYLTGDVMLDAVLSYRPVAEKRSRVLKQLDLRSKEYVLLTVHRAENTDSNERIEEIVDLLMRLQQPVVFPIHPRTRHKLASTRSLRGLAKLLFEAKHMRVIDPVSYLDMLALEDNARLVMTDSGGVQKEAYFLGVPCLTLREETEWVETLEGGWNRLVGADPKRTVPIVNSLWNNNGMRPVGRPNLAAFGGGKSAAFMVQKLMKEVR